VIPAASAIVVDPEFTERDLETTHDDSTATHVTFDGSNIQVTGDGATASNGVLTISAEGTYVVTGNLSDGQIIVAAADTDKIQIVLNGVTINCADNAPIYIKSANKVFVTLNKDTINTLTDGSAYVQTDENTVDAVIFSKADLTINGEGTLNITSKANHGIVSKDDLVITGGSITITNSVEGIEGTAIIVEGGTIDLTSQDDGFNRASGSAAETDIGGKGGGGAMENDANVYVSIAGGTINVNASRDGLDSNGNLYISGGYITVSGPTNNGNGALDYNGTADITGGTVVAVGPQ